MREPLLMLAACLLALWGFALLALSQERHFARVFGSNDDPALNIWAQRATAFIAISLSLPACIAAQGASFGSLLWVALICAAAMAIALTLTWRPQWLRRLPCPGACRTWGVESENRPQRGQFLPDLQAHSPAMGQKDGEKWTAEVDLQPTIPKSDRLRGFKLPR